MPLIALFALLALVHATGPATVWATTPLSALASKPLRALRDHGGTFGPTATAPKVSPIQKKTQHKSAPLGPGAARALKAFLVSQHTPLPRAVTALVAHLRASLEGGFGV